MNIYKYWKVLNSQQLIDVRHTYMISATVTIDDTKDDEEDKMMKKK